MHRQTGGQLQPWSLPLHAYAPWRRGFQPTPDTTSGLLANQTTLRRARRASACGYFSAKLVKRSISSPCSFSKRCAITLYVPEAWNPMVVTMALPTRPGPFCPILFRVTLVLLALVSCSLSQTSRQEDPADWDWWNEHGGQLLSPFGYIAGFNWLTGDATPLQLLFWTTRYISKGGVSSFSRIEQSSLVSFPIEFDTLNVLARNLD